MKHEGQGRDESRASPESSASHESTSQRSQNTNFPVLIEARFSEKLRFRNGLLWHNRRNKDPPGSVLRTEPGANHNDKEHHQTKGLMRKTTAVQVCSVNLCLFYNCSLKKQNDSVLRRPGGECKRRLTPLFFVFAFKIGRLSLHI